LGSNWAELVAPGEKAEARDTITRILCHGEPAEFTFHALNADGGFTPLQFSGVPVRNGGSVVAVFGLGHFTETTKPPTATTSGMGLTERQREILQFLADGRSTDEIASALHLSRTTVRNHVANLLTALGVHTRLQAVVTASRAGLVAR
jgi:DNA-binding CsgD family transcriptional regulator